MTAEIAANWTTDDWGRWHAAVERIAARYLDQDVDGLAPFALQSAAHVHPAEIDPVEVAISTLMMYAGGELENPLI